MVAADANGTLLDANPAFARMLGYRRAALRGRNVVDISHPDDAELTRATVTRVALGERAATVEKRYRRKDGGYVHALTSVAPVHGRRGALTCVLATVQDLTYRALAEAVARRGEAELHQFAGHVHDGVWISDRDRRHFSFLSETTARLWGVKREEVLADPYVLARMIHPDDFEQAIKVVKGLDEGPIEMRLRVTPPGQSLRWLRVRMFPIRNEVGEVTRIAGLTEDVTDQQTAAELLFQTQGQLVRLVEALREPMGVLSRVLGTGAANHRRDAERSPATVADSVDREHVHEFGRRQATLTAREREVMHLFAAGRSTRQIAAELRLSPKTIETHRAHVLRKTGATSIAELIRLVVLHVRRSPSRE
jgi:PAS domain S-box-containing protein